VPVPCFLLFLVSESYFWKYSRNCTKQKARSLFFQHVHGVRRRDEGEPRGGQTTWRRGRGPPPRQPVVWAPRGSADIAPSPIYSPRRENPKTPSLSSRTYSLPPPSSTLTRGVLKLFPAPCRRGESSPEGSTSPCPPPEWCVSSSSLDYGSIAVARWLSSPLVPSCLDLVSCLSWSRSSYCNATCCVCWDLTYIDTYVELNIILSCLCHLWSCMLSVTCWSLGQVNTCDSKRGYLCMIVGFNLYLTWDSDSKF
jgi:hypothetical protein